MDNAIGAVTETHSESGNSMHSRNAARSTSDASQRACSVSVLADTRELVRSLVRQDARFVWPSPSQPQFLREIAGAFGRWIMPGDHGDVPTTIRDVAWMCDELLFTTDYDALSGAERYAVAFVLLDCYACGLPSAHCGTPIALAVGCMSWHRPCVPDVTALTAGVADAVASAFLDDPERVTDVALIELLACACRGAAEGRGQLVEARHLQQVARRATMELDEGEHAIWPHEPGVERYSLQYALGGLLSMMLAHGDKELFTIVYTAVTTGAFELDG